VSEKPLKVVSINAGVGDPSSTGMLLDRLVGQLAEVAKHSGTPLEFRTINLRDLLGELPAALSTQLLGEKFKAAIELLDDADGIIAATPVYKAGASALFTGFFQVLDNDLLIGKPVLLGATAGTLRHALVVDDQMRGLFSYLRTITAPTSVFAAESDWNDPAFTKRLRRAGAELLALMTSDFTRTVREATWEDYQHDFGSVATSELGINLDTDLMRLAAGGN
jgi:FMN reductase